MRTCSFQNQCGWPTEIERNLHFRNIINKYPNLTKFHFDKKVPAHNVIHTIETGAAKPVKAKLRPIMKGTEKAIKGKKSWDELVALGIVERVRPDDPTLWTSALHLQPKSDGSLRACSDFRPLNAVTTLDTYPLPPLRSFTSAIKGAKIFSKLDLFKAFHLIPLTPSSSAKTATITPWGLFVYKRLAMGLRNSCQSFQRLVEWVLAGIDNCLVNDTS